MAISIERAQQHIQVWSERLKGGTHYFWPHYIYHTADVTVVPAILRSGLISCRAVQQSIICDVAAQEPLWRNPAAHNYARFYFRPRTLFHVVKEGIRALRDNRRTPTQMSIPVVLVFDATTTLSRTGVMYTKEKFANINAEIGDTEEFFDALDFAAIYHNSPTQDQAVRHKRMAEILFPNALPLTGHLKYLVCRTVYDRITLLSLLTQDEREDWKGKIFVEQISGTFFVHDFSLYIRDIKFDARTGLLSLSLKHPSQVGIGNYKCSILQIHEGRVCGNLDCEIPLSYQPLVLAGFQLRENCNWKIQLEDVLAFSGPIPSESSSVV